MVTLLYISIAYSEVEIEMGISKLKHKADGFTIVELLIVVVVIAVLAAITIVSYNGITSRANESAVKAQAATYQKKAELYISEGTRYPVQLSELTSDPTKSFYISTGDSAYTTFPATGTAAVPNATNLPADANATKRVLILKCHSATPGTGNDTQAEVTSTNISGLQVWYYNARTAARESINIGTAYASTGTAWSTAYCPQS